MSTIKVLISLITALKSMIFIFWRCLSTMTRLRSSRVMRAAAGAMAVLYGAVGGVRVVYVLGSAVAPYPPLLALAGILAKEGR